MFQAAQHNSFIFLYESLNFNCYAHDYWNPFPCQASHIRHRRVKIFYVTERHILNLAFFER
jgi:hypothetical protein